MRTTLAIGSSKVAVTSTAEETSSLVQSLFSPWRDPREEAAEFTIDIEREESDYRVTIPGIFSSRVDRASLVTTLEQVITHLACEILRDSLQIHAAAVDFDGTGVIISGSQGSGKTTLALTALSSGFTALTDEVAVFKNDHHTVMGFPRPFRAREGTCSLIPPVIPEDCPRVVSPDGITHVFFSSPGLRYFQPETRIAYLLFPIRRPGGTELRDISEREALLHLLPQGFNFYLRKDGGLSGLINIIRRARPMEIRFSDHWHAIHTLQEMISQNR